MAKKRAEEVEYHTEKMTYNLAEAMMGEFNGWNEAYLRSVVSNYISGEFAQNLDFAGLRHYGKIIFGIAKKKLASKPAQKLSNPERTSEKSGVEKAAQEQPKLRQGGLF